MHPATARAHGDRITPAHAGKRCYLCASTKSSWDHPRVGGEKTACVLIVGLGKGSPPHRRGKERRVVDHHPLPGITPAQAGKRIRRPDTERAYWDHPRVGGEKSRNDGVYYQSTGSPPHRRGKGGTDHSGDLRHGFTPAQAGKRTKAAAICRWCRDHPRAGGEKHNVFTLGSLVQGSPPRGRGKDSGTVHGCGQLRITPAWAGKSREIPLHLRAAKDHPRVGGEKTHPAKCGV